MAILSVGLLAFDAANKEVKNHVLLLSTARQYQSTTQGAVSATR